MSELAAIPTIKLTGSEVLNTCFRSVFAILMDRSSRVCSRNSSCSHTASSAGGDDGRLGALGFMIRCDLCKEAAGLYCPADEARLCWDCDARIHSANFLVARHSRAPLCPYCGALTPLRSPIRLHKFCQSCTEAAAAATYDLLHSDKESKVECSSDECCSDDDDDVEESLTLSCLRELIRQSNPIRKRSPPALWIEGAGDSEEDDYCHLLSSSHCKASGTCKRICLTME